MLSLMLLPSRLQGAESLEIPYLIVIPSRQLSESPHSEARLMDFCRTFRRERDVQFREVRVFEHAERCGGDDLLMNERLRPFTEKAKLATRMDCHFRLPGTQDTILHMAHSPLSTTKRKWKIPIIRS